MANLSVRNPQALAIGAAMITGALFGWIASPWAQPLEIASTIFLRLIRSIIAPVLFGVLVTAVAKAGGTRGLGRIGWRALAYFELSTSLALLLGWAAIAFTGIGSGTASAQPSDTATARPLTGFVIDSFPASIFEAMARGDVVQILIFCLLFGAAAGVVKKRAGAVIRFAEALTAVSFEFTRIVMWLAPVAVFAAIANVVARSPRGLVESLGGFVITAWIAQVLFLTFVTGGALVLARVPIREFARQTQEPFFVAVATTSSAAAIPKSLDAMERLGIPSRIYGIVTPLSVSLNLSGSCIHLAMCAFFAARAAGMELAVSQQIMILLTLKLTSKGVAGIPRANFVILTGLFAAFGLPAGMLPVLLGIDALIDPVRTSVNVLGHCAPSPVIAKWESPNP